MSREVRGHMIARMLDRYVLACLVFAAIYRHAIRTGLIARYSAESVS